MYVCDNCDGSLAVTNLLSRLGTLGLLHWTTGAGCSFKESALGTHLSPAAGSATPVIKFALYFWETTETSSYLSIDMMVQFIYFMQHIKHFNR